MPVNINEDTMPKSKIVEIQNRRGDSTWFISFFDYYYNEFILEFDYPFSSYEDAKKALETSLVYQDMSCKYNGK